MANLYPDMLAGYARVSTFDQNLHLQRDNFTHPSCERLFEARSSWAMPDSAACCRPPSRGGEVSGRRNPEPVQRHEIALTTRLNLQDAEASLSVMEGPALNRASERLGGRAPQPNMFSAGP